METGIAMAGIVTEIVTVVDVTEIATATETAVKKIVGVTETEDRVVCEEDAEEGAMVTAMAIARLLARTAMGIAMATATAVIGVDGMVTGMVTESASEMVIAVVAEAMVRDVLLLPRQVLRASPLHSPPRFSPAPVSPAPIPLVSLARSLPALLPVALMEIEMRTRESLPRTRSLPQHKSLCPVIADWLGVLTHFRFKGFLILEGRR